MWPFRSKPRQPAAALDVTDVSRRVEAFVSQRSGVLAGAALHADTPIFSSGLLDSLGFVELVTFVESDFDVRLGDAVDVKLANLDSLQQIAAAVVVAHTGPAPR